ncbi:hypothetical protein [Halorarius halobius]|uniref:hypothetical protein n=1 Tax=Halorarius halobius TaxID=2962671 RepID=UPI0020CCF0CF|nr:hypothetical protein [Halorarius halobius]
MAVPERAGDEEETTEPPVDLAVHSTSPDRTVFTEPGNSEAWLSTDYTVVCER